MNINSFYSYINNPNALNANSASELNEIIERYPFFQTPRLLYLKNLQILNDYRFNDELKSVSAYAVNRKVLFELVNEIDNFNEINDKIIVESESKFSVNEVIEEEVDIEKFEIVENTSEVIGNTIEEKGKQTTELIKENEVVDIDYEKPLLNTNNNIIESEAIVENIEVVSEKNETKQFESDIIVNTNPENITKIDNIEVIENKFEELKKELVVEPIVYKGKINEPIIETQIKETTADKILKKIAEIKAFKAQQSQQSEEQKKPIIIQKIPETKINTPEAIEQVETKYELKVKEIQSEISQKNTAEVNNIIPEIATTNNDLLDTDAILNLKEFNDGKVDEIQIFETPAYNLKEFDEKPLTENVSEIDISKEKMSFDQWIKYVSEKSKKIEKRKEQEQIIESFINSEPKINIANAPILDNSNELIKNNSIDEFSLVSETLADIYVNQSLFDKAIKMFEKLALKYPEKNIYFANRILEIKSKFNNQ